MIGRFKPCPIDNKQVVIGKGHKKSEQKNTDHPGLFQDGSPVFLAVNEA